MSAEAGGEKPPHVHYCKDWYGVTTCVRRGYCECECGARAVFTLEEGAGAWQEPLDLMGALKASLAAKAAT